MVELPSQGSGRRTQSFSDGSERRSVSEVLKKKSANFPGHAAAIFQIGEQFVAYRDDGGICCSIAETCRPIQPLCVECQLVGGLVESNFATEKFLGQAKILALRIGQRKFVWPEGGAHYVPLQRDVDAHLHFDDESVEPFIHEAMEERIDRPTTHPVALDIGNIDQRSRENMVLYAKLECSAKVRTAKNGVSVHSVGRDMNR